MLTPKSVLSVIGHGCTCSIISVATADSTDDATGARNPIGSFYEPHPIACSLIVRSL